MNTCDSCNGYFCGSSCGFVQGAICKTCEIAQEHDELFDVIFESLNKYNILTDINVIRIIVSYSIGYIVQCCNYLKCNHEIKINNKFEFYQYNRYRQSVQIIQKIMFHGGWDGSNCTKPTYNRKYWQNYDRKILKSNDYYYWYLIEKQQNEYDTIKYVYDKEIRIFCANCIEYEIYPCKYSRASWHSLCKNGEIHEQHIPRSSGRAEMIADIYSDFGDVGPLVICKLHIFCQVCLSRETGYDARYRIDDFYEYCSECNKYYCPTCDRKYHGCGNVYDDKKLYHDIDDEMSKYDDDPVFIKTCKPYSLI